MRTRVDGKTASDIKLCRLKSNLELIEHMWALKASSEGTAGITLPQPLSHEERELIEGMLRKDPSSRTGLESILTNLQSPLKIYRLENFIQTCAVPLLVVPLIEIWSSGSSWISGMTSGIFTSGFCFSLVVDQAGPNSEVARQKETNRNDVTNFILSNEWRFG